MALISHESRPFLSLTATFAAWKGFLLAVALGAAAAPDYDTSTSIFFDVLYGNSTTVPALATRLTRWDALYYMSTSRNGDYVHEQDWAFAYGLPAVVRSVGAALAAVGAEPTGVWEPMVAIAFGHLSHFIAVLALYQLTVTICNDRRLAFVASVLHILTPGGLFLSAPYSESPFSCLSFVGNLIFALGIKKGPDSLRRNVALVGAGLVFGLSNMFRSNGLFSGLLFAVEAVNCLLALIAKPSFTAVLRLIAPGIGGVLVATGVIVPQVVAWMRYCSDIPSELGQRPWCTRMIPSIYTFVQEEYWNVGFLKYWTPNQIPLFLLATPVLTLLIKSGIDVLREPSRGLKLMGPGTNEQYRTFVRTLAAGQTLLAVLAITNYHVQIISRISSGYAVWYWWIAACLMDQDKGRRTLGRSITMFAVMYASIQGALFASFLPPA